MLRGRRQIARREKLAGFGESQGERRSRVRARSQNRAHTHEFRSILRDVRHPRDWSVEQKGFEPSVPTSPFYRKIAREVGGLFSFD